MTVNAISRRPGYRYGLKVVEVNDKGRPIGGNTHRFPFTLSWQREEVENPYLCSRGFHALNGLSHARSYFNGRGNQELWLVELRGVVTPVGGEAGKDKFVGSNIRFVARLCSREELLVLANEWTKTATAAALKASAAMEDEGYRVQAAVKTAASLAVHKRERERLAKEWLTAPQWWGPQGLRTQEEFDALPQPLVVNPYGRLAAALRYLIVN